MSDNLRKGGATNAVQLAELLHERGLLRSATRAWAASKKLSQMRARR